MKNFTDINKVRLGAYRRSLNKYGPNYKALQWTREDAQLLRFNILLKDLEIENKLILDFGCGMGDLVGYISGKTDKFNYTGIDLVPEFIAIAKDRYLKVSGKDRSVKFQCRDLNIKPISKKFDLVVSSGVLNSKLLNMAKRKQIIHMLWDYSKEALVFNMAGGYPQPANSKHSKIYYADSLVVLKYCLSLTSKIIFRQDYGRKDFSIQMFRN